MLIAIADEVGEPESQKLLRCNESAIGPTRASCHVRLGAAMEAERTSLLGENRPALWRAHSTLRRLPIIPEG